jgi:glutathione S-transferase
MPLVLEELGLRYERVPIGFTGETQTLGYLRINPNGRVPTLEDDGETLWESIAINLYLADKYCADSFWPSRAEGRGKCYQWSLWAVDGIEPRVSAIMAHRIRNPPERGDPEVARQALEELNGPFGILEVHLSNRQFLLGDALTIADINVASTTRVLFLTHKIDPSMAAFGERSSVARTRHLSARSRYEVGSIVRHLNENPSAKDISSDRRILTKLPSESCSREIGVRSFEMNLKILGDYRSTIKAEVSGVGLVASMSELEKA